MTKNTIHQTKQSGQSNQFGRGNDIKASDTTCLEKIESTQSLDDCEQLEAGIRELHREYVSSSRTTLRLAYQLGAKLTQLKAVLKKQSLKVSWETYVHEKLQIHPRTASNYMRVFSEASTIEGGISELVNSDASSKLGIREALDILAERKAQNAVEESGNAATEEVKPTPSATPEKAHDQPALKLADGSRIKLERIQWSDGLLPRSAIESWLNEAPTDSADQQSRKIEARRQRVVIQLAAGINRACGKADSSTALELVESSLDEIRKILHKSHIA